MEEYKMVEIRRGRQLVLAMDDGISIGLKSGIQEWKFETIKGCNYLIKLGPWLVERAQGTIGFRMNGSDSDRKYPEKKKLSLYFRGKHEEKTAEVTLLFIDKSVTSRKQRIIKKQVESIILEGDSIKLMMPGESGEENVMNPAPVDANDREIAPAEELSHGTENAFAVREKEFLDQICKLEKIIKELEEGNRKLNLENETLRANTVLSDQLAQERGELEKLTREAEAMDSQLKQIRAELSQRRDELLEKEEQIKTASEDKKSTEAEIAALEQKKKKNDDELTGLRKELDRMKVIDEINGLEIDQVKKEILGIRERLSDDALTLSAMEDDIINGTGSVKESLTKAETELEKAEKKIGLIIKIRETINEHVQEAVVRKGSGFLTAAGETGGE